MARLLASYAHARFVFIDVRDVTPHVETEIQLSYLAMGPDRCVFMVHPKRTDEEWTTTIRKVLDLQPGEQATFHLLSYPGDQQVDPSAFVPAVRKLVDGLPTDPAEIADQTIAFAQKHVPESQWPTPFSETDAASTLFSTLGLVLIFAVSVFSLSHALRLALDYVLLAFIGANYVFYLTAWFRAWKQGGLEARFRRPRERNPRWRLALSLILMFVPVAVFGVVVVKKQNESFHGAQHARVSAEITNIKTGLLTYQAMNGLFPTTEQGLKALATQPDTEPKPERWYRFYEEVPKDPWQNPYIYRCPGIKNPTSYDLFSAGPDRIADTADDDWGQ